jgi:hypothetical protein
MLTKRDPVPALSRELDLSRVPTGAGAEVYQLAGTGGQAPQLVHGYELSVARMLDGQRTVEDVLTNCERIGVPMDEKALEGLLDRLGKAGYFADPQHPGMAEHDPHGPRRAQWTPEARDLYREALKCAREGDFSAAREAIEAMLLQAPDTAEALQLREWLARHPGASAAKALASQLRHTEAELRGGRAPLHLRPKVEKWFARPPRWLLPTLVVAGALALLAATTFVPVSRLELARVRLDPMSKVIVTTTEPLVVERLLVKDGDLVAAGQPLVQWKAPSGAEAVLRATEAGEVHRMRLTVGKRLMANEEALQLIDRSHLRVQVSVTPRAAKHSKPGDVIRIALADQTLPMVIENVDGYELTGVVANLDRALAMKSVDANIELPPRSLWQTLW